MRTDKVLIISILHSQVSTGCRHNRQYNTDVKGACTIGPMCYLKKEWEEADIWSEVWYLR